MRLNFGYKKQPRYLFDPRYFEIKAGFWSEGRTELGCRIGLGTQGAVFQIKLLKLHLAISGRWARE